MTLQEFQASGECSGCMFYGIIDYILKDDNNLEPVTGCTFDWFDDDSEDWEYGKNCDELD